MDKDSFFGPYGKYVAALLPVFGVALTSVNQIGRLAFYEVPYELMEFSTVSTLLSAIALTVTSSAGLLSIAIAYTRDLQTWWHRAIHHIFLASMLTAPFWIKSVNFGHSISWPTVLFMVGLAGAGYMTESYYRSVKSGTDSTNDLQTRIEKALHVALVLGFMTLAGSFSHGYLYAKESPMRLFIRGTNDLVAGSFNGDLVIKRYDPKKGVIDKAVTSLLSPQARLELEKRGAPVRR